MTTTTTSFFHPEPVVWQHSLPPSPFLFRISSWASTKTHLKIHNIHMNATCPLQHTRHCRLWCLWQCPCYALVLAVMSIPSSLLRFPTLDVFFYSNDDLFKRLVVYWCFLYYPICKPQLWPLETLPVCVLEFCVCGCCALRHLLEAWIDRLMKGFELLGLPVIARIHLISLVPCSAFSVWVLKHLITPIMRSLLWHVCCSFSPFMWIRVYLTGVYVSHVWCASQVSEFALQLQGKPAPAPFHLLTRLFFLCIEYPDYLPDMTCMHTVLFLSQKVTYLFCDELGYRFKSLWVELGKQQKMLLSLRSSPQTMSPYIQKSDGLCTRTDHHMLLPIVLHMVVPLYLK